MCILARKKSSQGGGVAGETKKPFRCRRASVSTVALMRMCNQILNYTPQLWLVDDNRVCDIIGLNKLK